MGTGKSQTEWGWTEKKNPASRKENNTGLSARSGACFCEDSGLITNIRTLDLQVNKSQRRCRCRVKFEKSCFKKKLERGDSWQPQGAVHFLGPVTVFAHNKWNLFQVWLKCSYGLIPSASCHWPPGPLRTTGVVIQVGFCLQPGLLAGWMSPGKPLNFWSRLTSVYSSLQKAEWYWATQSLN